MWHWREECRLWPAFGYLESPQFPPGGKPCALCTAMVTQVSFHKVTEIIDGNTIEVSPRWFFGGLYGIRVRFGERPCAGARYARGNHRKTKAIRSCWRSSDRVAELLGRERWPDCLRRFCQRT